jgi:L-alanine-DL-glutamate epimerase-like enolase superfamily enzyme
MVKSECPIRSIKTSVYKIPTDLPESDGTIQWDSTTLVLVEIEAEGEIGLGFTYAHEATSEVIQKTFTPLLKNANCLNIPFLWKEMLDASRNLGTRGIVANAISAVDTALWDLKAKLLKLPLCQLFGQVREGMPIYGSGGFTSYTKQELAKQFEEWRKEGITKFKMKVGRGPEIDPERVRQARKVIGPNNQLFVDANGAYTTKQALELAEHFKEFGVCWFEEPVIADDLKGLHLLSLRAPPGMDIAAGEYGYDIYYFRTMLEAISVDVLQADATRCRGFTGFIEVSTLSKAFNIPLSSHCAPSLHLHVCLSQRDVCHMEYFHDHVRIEKLFFEGFPRLMNGCLYPHLDRFGHGLKLKEKDVKKFLIGLSTD